MIDELLEELRTRPATDDEIKALRRATRVTMMTAYPDGETGLRSLTTEEAAEEIRRLRTGIPAPKPHVPMNGGCKFTITSRP